MSLAADGSDMNNYSSVDGAELHFVPIYEGKQYKSKSYIPKNGIAFTVKTK